MKVIFLDFDGVINGCNRLNLALFMLLSKIGSLRFAKRHYNLFGVHTYKVIKLAVLARLTGAKIVLTSSWRNSWKVFDSKDKEILKLRKLFRLFRLEVIGITPHVDSKVHLDHRELEIQAWLRDTYYKVEQFVILDDESFDLECFKEKELIVTKPTYSSQYSGLQWKHIWKALRVLNSKHE